MIFTYTLYILECAHAWLFFPFILRFKFFVCICVNLKNPELTFFFLNQDFIFSFCQEFCLLGFHP